MRNALIVVAFGLAAVTAFGQPHEDKWDIGKVDASKLPPSSEKTGLTYNADILPLFKTSCIRCHGAEKPHGGYRVDSLEATLKGGHDGKMVVPGDSAKSLLVAAVAQIAPQLAMPPKPRGPRGPMRDSAGTNMNASSPPPGGAPPPGGPPGAPPRNFTPPPPLTVEQVGIVRAWIDQGAK